MPQLIRLSKQPNQSFSFSAGRNIFLIRIGQSHGCMFADVVINGSTIVTGQRLCAGIMVLPYRRYWTKGNFVFETQNDELPWWENFGSSCHLYYMAPEEIDGSIPQPLPEKRIPVDG